MTPIALGLSLAALSALCSAASHAFLKAGDDKLAVRVWSCLICAAAALPFAIWTGPLPQHLWLTMAGFAVLSAVNQIVLIRSYQLSDFSLAYPVARGVVPVSMAVLGVICLGDQLSVADGGGIAAITLGILALAIGKGMSRHGWGAALFTGLTTIGYNLMAAQGIRAASDTVNFLAWLYLTDAIFLPAYLISRSGSGATDRLRETFRASWPAGVLTLIGFTTLTYAMRLAPIGIVSAIRESSVLIALVLAAAMLKERLDKQRIIAGFLIVLGAVTIVLG